MSDSLEEYLEEETYLHRLGCKSGNHYCILRENMSNKYLGGLNHEEILKKEDILGEGTLEDVTDNCAGKCGYKALARKLFNRRLLEQLRCIDDYKWILSEGVGYEIDRENAARRWVRDGFAQIFDIVYRKKKGSGEKIRHWDLYMEIERIRAKRA